MSHKYRYGINNGINSENMYQDLFSFLFSFLFNAKLYIYIYIRRKCVWIIPSARTIRKQFRLGSTRTSNLYPSCSSRFSRLRPIAFPTAVSSERGGRIRLSFACALFTHLGISCTRAAVFTCTTCTT